MSVADLALVDELLGCRDAKREWSGWSEGQRSGESQRREMALHLNDTVQSQPHEIRSVDLHDDAVASFDADPEHRPNAAPVEQDLFQRAAKMFRAMGADQTL